MRKSGSYTIPDPPKPHEKNLLNNSAVEIEMGRSSTIESQLQPTEGDEEEMDDNEDESEDDDEITTLIKEVVEGAHAY